MSYRSMVFYTGTGASQNLSVTFPYLDITHCFVAFLNPATGLYVDQESNTWSWLNASTITLNNPDTTADGVKIYRSTGFDPVVTFTNASLLNQDDQNSAALQAIYLLEEIADGTALRFTTNETIVTTIEQDIVDLNINLNRFAITMVLNGSSNPVGTGLQGFLQIPFPCTILEAHAYAAQTGTIVVDIWSDTYGNFPPTNADSIAASAPVTITAGVKSKDTTLTGWDITIPQDAILAFNVDSNDTVEILTITLVVEKT